MACSERVGIRALQGQEGGRGVRCMGLAVDSVWGLGTTPRLYWRASPGKTLPRRVEHDPRRHDLVLLVRAMRRDLAAGSRRGGCGPGMASGCGPGVAFGCGPGVAFG